MVTGPEAALNVRTSREAQPEDVRDGNFFYYYTWSDKTARRCTFWLSKGVTPEPVCGGESSLAVWTGTRVGGVPRDWSAGPICFSNLSACTGSAADSAHPATPLPCAAALRRARDALGPAGSVLGPPRPTTAAAQPAPRTLRPDLLDGKTTPNYQLNFS